MSCIVFTHYVYYCLFRTGWENTSVSKAFDGPHQSDGVRNFARDYRKQMWRLWCKTIFGLWCDLRIGEEGTTSQDVQLGECSVCSKSMYREVSDFLSMDRISASIQTRSDGSKNEITLTIYGHVCRKQETLQNWKEHCTYSHLKKWL